MVLLLYGGFSMPFYQKVRYRVVALSLVLVMFALTISSVNGEGITEVPKSVRIGLTTYYEHVDSIHIYNHTVIPGFYTEDGFVAESTLSTSGDDFWLSAASRLYLESEQTYSSYEEALAKVAPLRDAGYKAYATLMAEKTWKVFAGHKNSQSEIDTIKAAINGLNDVTYQNAPASNERVLMESASNYPIMFENRYDRVVLSTEDLRGDDKVIDLGKRSYRGYIEVGRYGWDDLTVVNQIDLDEYLYSVVVSEIYAKWPEETLKAQSVAARSYAVYHIVVYKKFKNDPFDLDDTVNSQVYKGYALEDERVNDAVDATTNELILYNGTVIPAYFFGASGGRTESSENVWGGTYAYLKSVPDIYEQEPERHPWLMTWTPSEIASKLSERGESVGTVTDIQAIGYSDAGRVMTLRIVGTGGSLDLDKEKMRQWLGIWSRKFTVLKSDYRPDTTYDAVSSDGQTTINYNGGYVVNGDGSVEKVLQGTDQVIVMGAENIINQPMISGQSGKFILAGQGWGHGVGMSQAGAKGMANEGYTYREILEHYYTDTVIQ